MAQNVAEVISRRKLKKIVYLSTTDVYGYPEKVITEETNIDPQTYYASAKYCSERVLKTVSDKSGNKLLILRYNGIFGPGQKSTQYGPNLFIKQILTGNPIDLWGAGEDKRNFVYVKDLAKIICLLTLGKHYGVFNISAGENTTFAEVVLMLKKITNKNFQVIHKKRTGNLFHQNFDLSKLKKTLPKLKYTSLPVSLEKTYRWYSKNMV